MEQTVETIGLNMILSLTDQEKVELIRMWEERKKGETPNEVGIVCRSVSGCV